MIFFALAAIQVLGGNGYVGEYQVERLWRDAKLLEIGGKEEYKSAWLLNSSSLCTSFETRTNLQEELMKRTTRTWFGTSEGITRSCCKMDRSCYA